MNQPNPPQVRPALIAAVKDAVSRDEGTAVIKALTDRFGIEWVEAQMMARAAIGGSESNPFARGLRPASALPASRANQRLWFGCYPGTLCYLVGDTGVGKSTLLYLVAHSGALNQELFTVPFGLGRPLNILYLDPENAGGEDDGGNCRLKLDRMGIEFRPYNLVFHDARGLDLSDPRQMAALTHLIQHPEEFVPTDAEDKPWNLGPFDLVILDPLANLYTVADENSNAEAAKRVKALKTMATQTGACVILVHHDSPKSGTGGITGYGRGATATLAGVDTAYLIRAREGNGEIDDNFLTRGPVDRSGVIRWQVVKNRLGGRGSIYLRMLGADQFEATDFQAWKEADKADQGMSLTDKIRGEVEIELSNGDWVPMEQIVRYATQQGPQFRRHTIQATVQAMVADGTLATRSERGRPLYRLKALADTDGSMKTYQAPRIPDSQTALDPFEFDGSDHAGRRF